jgi:predicted transcriptional regulator
MVLALSMAVRHFVNIIVLCTMRWRAGSWHGPFVGRQQRAREKLQLYKINMNFYGLSLLQKNVIKTANASRFCRYQVLDDYRPSVAIITMPRSIFHRQGWKHDYSVEIICEHFNARSADIQVARRGIGGNRRTRSQQ